jgi:hypothetical protein
MGGGRAVDGTSNIANSSPLDKRRSTEVSLNTVGHLMVMQKQSKGSDSAVASKTASPATAGPLVPMVHLMN